MLLLLICDYNMIPPGELIWYLHLFEGWDETYEYLELIMQSVISLEPVLIYNTLFHSPSLIHEPVAP